MNPSALLLILIAAVIHSYWNFVLKKSIKQGGDYLLIYWLANIAGGIIYLPVFIILLNFFELSVNALLPAFLCGVFFAVYYFFLSKSYYHGDLSYVYPLAKTTPLFTLIIGFFYLKEKISIPAFFGILLIVFGAYLIHLKNFKPGNLLRPIASLKNKVSVFAIITAISSSFYGLFSKLGAEIINPFIFIYIAFIFSVILYTPFLLLKHKNIKEQFKKYKKTIIKIGIMDIGAYSLIVFTLSFTNLSYVFALRQISVVFSVLIGYKMLKEKNIHIRLIAALIIFIGIFLIGIS